MSFSCLTVEKSVQWRRQKQKKINWKFSSSQWERNWKRQFILLISIHFVFINWFSIIFHCFFLRCGIFLLFFDRRIIAFNNIRVENELGSLLRNSRRWVVVSREFVSIANVNVVNNSALIKRKTLMSCSLGALFLSMTNFLSINSFHWKI